MQSITKQKVSVTTLSLWVSMFAIATWAAWAAWSRRWISDDGLIVLRTVRNLLAGNGPVFNINERVEANTSTVWTYLIWFFSWVTGGQTEYVVLWISLVLTVLAFPVAMYATAQLFGKSLKRYRTTLLLPLGPIIYLALPPARDFATSGLEVSLCLFWCAVLWLQFVWWSTRRFSGRKSLWALAFTAGLAPLIRPELAIVGALVLIVVFIQQMRWTTRIGFIVAAGALPVGYQIFRMGYYGVLVPNTAIAKDASDAKWDQGFAYVDNLFHPYFLLLPLILAAFALIASLWNPQNKPQGIQLTKKWSPRISLQAIRFGIQKPGVAIAVMMAGGLIEAVYWIRQGGDFMHGRVLLPALFLLLLPVMVIPLKIPDGTLQLRSRAAVWGVTGGLAGVFFATVAWAALHANSQAMTFPPEVGRSGIVDERAFYISRVQIAHPITAADYLEFPRMRAMVRDVESELARNDQRGSVLIPASSHDQWTISRTGRQPQPRVTVYMLNMGMTSMNLPLSVRVVDEMGLTYPLASHTDRLGDGRIGHDKSLPAPWILAESGVPAVRGSVPWFLKKDDVKRAATALRCPETVRLKATYTGPITWARFKQNIKESVIMTGYRMNRIPDYELQRCQLPDPIR